MKYVDCPKCKNKIIEREPLKCIYCGYNSSEEPEEETIELTPLNPPKKPSSESHVFTQVVTLLASVVGFIGFLITLFYTKPTVIDYVLVEVKNENLTMIRYIFLIMAGLALITFFSKTGSYNEELHKYNEQYRTITDINNRIKNGATINDFDSEERILIMNDQDIKAQQNANQKSTRYK